MRVSVAARNFVVLCVCTSALTAAWALSLVLQAGGVAATQGISNVGQAAAALAAMGGCLVAARRDAHLRRTWGLLAAAAGSWGAGQILWTWYESFEREVPFPSLADVGFLGLIPLAAAALVSLPTGRASVAVRSRSVLDGLIIATSLLLISWTLILGPVFDASSGGFLEHAIGLAYPMGDVVLATLVLTVWLRARRAARAHGFPLGMIGAGLIAFAIADTGFAYMTATGTYASGALTDIGWFTSFALLFLAGVRSPRPIIDEKRASRHDEAVGVLLPYAAVALALAASAPELAYEGAADPMLAWLRALIIAALVVRQVLTLIENRSLTQRLETQVEELRTSEQRFRGLVQHSSDVVTVVDRALTVRYQSESIERVFGYLADALLGRPIRDLLDGESLRRVAETAADVSEVPYAIGVVELKVRHRSGRLCDAEMTITNLLEEPSVRGLVLNTRDITERKSLEDQLFHSAFHDSLTALANRALFRRRIDEKLSAASTARKIGLLFLDLDAFKQVNDLLGHTSGDLLLVQVADRLRRCVRPDDVVARLGGDEFGILLVDATEEVVGAAAERITEALRDPFVVEGHEVHVRGSVGVAVAVAGADFDTDRLLRNADVAMYRAKAAGQGGYERYEPGMHLDVVERIQLEGDLRRALEGDELILHYQPTVVLDSNAFTGVEALVRWNHPTRGLIAPTQFIPLAEESGLIVPLGRWVLYEACRQAVEWRSRFPERQLTMSVNISGGQLKPGFEMLVADALAEAGLDPTALVLEMTESVLMENSDENLELFNRLKDLGVKLAIDDFGTGYSSLSYLHRFPVDVLKIDRSFVESLSLGDGEGDLVETIVKLGHSLGMKTVAEGIEGSAQVEALRSYSCELGQGYHFARPLPADQVERLFAAQQLAPPRIAGRRAA